MGNYGIDRNGNVYEVNPDKLRPWTCNFKLDFDHIKPWTVRDPGLGFGLKNMFKWEGEEMGIPKQSGRYPMDVGRTDCFGGDLVNGGLYYRDDDGNFVKLMNVTNIEKTTNLCDTVGVNVDIKVNGYPPMKPETVEVKDTGRRMLGSMSAKFSPEDHVYFMIFDGTPFSVKISRTIVGLSPDYNHPYSVTVYDSGKILWTKKYDTWRALECSFMYDISGALNAWFPVISASSNSMARCMQEVARVVKYHYINTDSTELRAIEQVKKLEGEKRRDFFKELLEWQFKNGANGYLRKDTIIENVIFNDPATIVFWKDGTKTVVHAQNGEPYDKEKGLAMAISKKAFGNKRDYYNFFKRWLRKGWTAPEKEE